MKRLRHRFSYLCLGLAAGVLLAVIASLPHQSPANAVAGTATFTGTDQTLTGDITAGRLLDQANTAYLIDPAASGTSLVTAGKVGIGTTTITDTVNLPSGGTMGFISGGKIKDASGALQLQAGGTTQGAGGNGNIEFLDGNGVRRSRIETVGTGSGSGADGALTVSTSVKTDGTKAGISTTSSSGQKVVSVSSTTGFSAGNEVLLIQMTGTGAGNYETRTIDTIQAGTSLTMTANLTNAYTNDGSSKAQVIKVPNYTTVTVSSGGTITADAWNGTTGGVVFFRATSTVNVQSGGTITVAGLGFSGGGGGSGGNGSGNGGGGAAGTAISSCTCALNAAGNGGVTSGGGGGGGGGPSCSGAGGNGGAGTTNAGNSGTSVSSPGGGAANTGGTNSSNTALTSMLLGGGGGGGNGGTGAQGGGGGGGGGANVAGGAGAAGSAGSGTAGSGGAGGTGGTGGGIVFIKADTITIAGTVSANGTTGSSGTAGGSGANGGAGGAGGGGSCNSATYGGGGGGGGKGGDGGTGGSGGGGGGGGAIYFSAATLTLGSNLTTSSGGSAGSGGAGGTGGTGGGGGAGGSGYGSQTGAAGSAGSNGSSPAGSAGTAGGGGKIRLESTSSSGTVSPTAASTGSYTPDSTGYGTFYSGATNTSSTDLAEYYVSGDNTIEAGDVVAMSNVKLQMTNEKGVPEEVVPKGVLRKARSPYDRNLIGIISTKPGVLMGSDDLDPNRGEKRMLALAGRVPVKIDPDSPAIAVGDFLTSSPKPGLARKATQPGYVVARALESWQPDGPATIEAFIQLTYYMGDIDPWGNFRTLEVDTLKVNKTLEVGGVNVMDEIERLKRRLDALEKK